MTQELSRTTAVSTSLARISHLLRQFLRSQGGENADSSATRIDDDEDREPWTSTSDADHALEREIELARLEKENEELKRMKELIDLVPLPRKGNMDSRSTFEPPPRQEPHRAHNPNKLGGAAGTVGPYGTYKRYRSPG